MSCLIVFILGSEHFLSASALQAPDHQGALQASDMPAGAALNASVSSAGFGDLLGPEYAAQLHAAPAARAEAMLAAGGSSTTVPSGAMAPSAVTRGVSASAAAAAANAAVSDVAAGLLGASADLSALLTKFLGRPAGPGDLSYDDLLSSTDTGAHSFPPSLLASLERPAPASRPQPPAAGMARTPAPAGSCIVPWYHVVSPTIRNLP